MPPTIQRNGGIRRNNTTISDDGTVVRVTLHQTEIFTFNRATGVVHLNTGGWNTPTTHRRMNECLHHFDLIGPGRPFACRVGKSDFRASLVWSTFGPDLKR